MLVVTVRTVAPSIQERKALPCTGAVLPFKGCRFNGGSDQDEVLHANQGPE
jgi:hypothetical protein